MKEKNKNVGSQIHPHTKSEELSMTSPVGDRIYLDYAASTPLDKRVKKAMEPFWSRHFGNPGGIHKEGQFAKKTVDDARMDIAKLLQVEAGEIIFTSGGTESNSLAIMGLVNFLEDEDGLDGAHIITSKIEHPSVLKVFKGLEKKGLSVDFLEVNKEGLVDIKEVREKIKPETKMISVMYVNNEVGTIQPIREISQLIKKLKKEDFFLNSHDNSNLPAFHTDASQAPLFLNINPHSLGVDMMTVDAQKIYGPKGAGLLYKSRDIKIDPILIGGSQERGLRPGTENVPLIVGLARSLEFAQTEREELSKRIKALQGYFIDEVSKRIEGVELNGSTEKRVPNNVNLTIPRVDGEFGVIKLDQKGIAASNRSACIKDGGSASYVIEAMTGTGQTGIRFTLGRETTKKEIDKVINVLVEISK